MVKTPALKVPTEVTPNIPSKSLPEENNEQIENSQLQGKIQKWKSLYRHEKPTQEETDVGKNSGNIPGLKEAHKQLSLENYKLKKAYSDIQKQLDIMKVMSWYRRAQVDKLKQNEQINMSYVVGMLKKELQYLEEVYFREKRLADMWRNEEKQKVESLPNAWKNFKHRWNKKYKDDEGGNEEVCMDKKDCESKTATDVDTSGSNSKETVDHIETLHISSTGTDDTLEQTDVDLNRVEELKTKGDYGTLDGDTLSDEDNIHHYPPELLRHLGRTVRDKKDSLFWRHLRKPKAEEDVVAGATSSNNTEQINEEELSREEYSDDQRPNDINKENFDAGNDKPALTQPKQDWFTYEVLEHNEDTIIAFENKDSSRHIIYAFLDNEFRKIESKPGDIFVMAIKTECFDMNKSFIVSILNDSPQKIQFFALLPNGKINHQKVAQQVNITIINLKSKDNDVNEVMPSIYEATVMEDGNLNVSKREQHGESGEQNNKYGDQGSKNDVESGDGNMDINKRSDLGSKQLGYSDSGVELNGDEFDESGDESVDEEESSNSDDQSDGENKIENEHKNEETQEKPKETSQPIQEVPLSSLQPGESYMYDSFNEKMYRRTVSAHQYPISNYKTLLTQTHGKIEVYYRFSENMIMETFIVNIEEINDDGSVKSVDENEDQTLMEDSSGNTKPVEYEEDVANIVQELLKNPWKDQKRTPILMTYDGTNGKITSIFVTLSKVHPDDVISHDMLKNGKVETIGENLKITSYLLHGYELLRVVREDDVKYAFPKLRENTMEDDGTAETEDENSRNTEEDINSSDLDDKVSSNFEDNDEVSDYYKKQNTVEAVDDVSNGDVPPSEDSAQEKCVMKLGDSDTTEYWLHNVQEGARLIHEKVERLMPTPKFKDEDLMKLNISNDNIEESVSYVYCEDGSVQKTWRRIEKFSQNVDNTSSENNDGRDKSETDDSENLQEHDEQEYYGDKEYPDDIDDEYDDYDNIDDGIDTNNFDDIDDNDDDNEDIDDDDDDNDDDDNDIDDDIDDDDNDIGDDNDDDDIDDDIDDDVDEDIDDIDDDNDEAIDDIDDDDNDHDKFDGSDNLHTENDYDANEPNVFGDDRKGIVDDHNINDKPDPELEKERYETFISREWQNLKLRQQQFEHSEKQNIRLQQQMLKEWDKMKQQYKKFQESVQKTQRTELEEEIEGLWNDLKHQQKQFDNMKEQIEAELRKSLLEEWEKLTKKQKEIEMREKELMKDETMMENVPNDIDGRYKQQPEVTANKQPEHNYEVQEGEIEDSNDSETEDDPLMRNVDSYVDTSQSNAWEMSDSDTVYTRKMEDNLPHELPYIPRKNQMPDYHVDKMLSEAWESLQEPSDSHEEQDVVQDNHEMHKMINVLAEESPYIPSSGSSSEPEMSDSFFLAQGKQQKENFPKEITSGGSTETPRIDEKVFNIVERQNMEESFPGETTYTTLIENTARTEETMSNEDNEIFVETSDTGLPNVKSDGTHSSSQWEEQIQKLREELDRLYKAKNAQRNGLQVINSPITPNEGSNAKFEGAIQPKCPAKCPNTNSYSECSPKWPRSDSTEDVSPIYPSSIPVHSPNGPVEQRKRQDTADDDTNMSPIPNKSYQESNDLLEMQTNDQNANSNAFRDYIEGHAYLQQLQPEEYDEKLIGFEYGPLAPQKSGRKTKTSKGKSKDGKHGKRNSRKKRKYIKKSKRKSQEHETARPLKEWKPKENYPLIPQRGKKSSRKENKLKKQKTSYK